MSDEVVYMSLEEMCANTIKEISVGKGKGRRMIRYNGSVPLKKLLAWQTACKMGTKEPDQEGYYARLLHYCLVTPRCPDLKAARQLLTGDGGLMLQIIGDVLKTNMVMGDEGPEGDDDLGESEDSMLTEGSQIA